VIAFVTLRNGAKFGLTVLAWIALPTIALAVKGIFSIFAVGFIHCIIVFVLALSLRHTHRWNDLLFILTLVFVAFVGLIHVFVPEVGQEWHKLLMQFMQSWVAQGQQEPAYWPAIVKTASKIGTGIVSFTLMTFMFLELMVARFWQSVIYNPGAFKREILQIRINRWVSLLLPLVFVLIVMTHNPTLTDMYPVVVFPMTVAGLVVIHAFGVAKPNARFFVPVAYVATFIFSYLICLWAVVGLVDAWINFPSRAKVFELLEKGEK
jgi:hypothetical protein